MYGVTAADRDRRCLSALSCFLVVGLVGSASLLHFSNSCHAQQPAEINESGAAGWEFGYELLQMLVEERGLTPVSAWDEVSEDPSNAVVILLGDLTGMSQPDWLRLRRFVGMGGSVLVASDQTYGPGGFRSGPVSAVLSDEQYQGFADCVRVRDINRAHSLMTGVRELIANRTGWVLPPLNDNSILWEVLATLPSRCLPVASSGKPLIVAGQTRSNDTANGLIILAADQSLFTNNMLWHGDNAILAIRVSDLLCRGNRNKVLFQSDGKSLGSYRENPQIGGNDTGGVPEELPEPELKTILRLANSVISEVEQSNLLNELLMKQPRNMRPRNYQRAILLLLAMLGAFILLWNFAQKDVVQPRPVPGRMMLSAHALEVSQRAPVETYGSAAEILAAALCRDLTGSDVPSEWQRWVNAVAEDSAKLPFVHDSSDRKALTTIVDLAVRGRKAGISRRQFQQIGRQIHQLRHCAELQQLVTK